MGHRRARERRREPDGTEETESKPGHRAEETTDTDREGSRSERPPGIVNRSTVDTSGRQATAGDVRGEEGGVGPASGYVGYERGPDRAALSARYGMAVRRSEAERLRRLESEHGSDQVGRWADEGMTVDTMGRPRDMQAFRERQAGRPEEVPADIERRNQASVDRNRTRNRDDEPAGNTDVPDAVRRVVSSPGRLMDETVQREMESKMGDDFGNVQVHTGVRAAAAESINARAFTVSNHVAFNRGEYSPDSEEGKKTLAHEPAHVRQGTDGRVSMLPKSDTGHPVTRDTESMHVQPKLEVSSPDDPAEESEDPQAQVDRRRHDIGLVRTVPVSRAASAGDAATGNADTESQVWSAVQGSGKPLPSGVKTECESKMGAEFSDVQVYTDTTVDEAARSINARAYTLGSDIAFADGNYNPRSNDGKKPLAHELTHVVQQRGESVSRVHRQESDTRVPLEDEENPGMVNEVAETTVKNAMHDLIEDGAKNLVKKGGVTAGKAALVGAAVIAVKKCALSFAKRAAKEMHNARKRIRNWIEKQVEKSSAPEFAARARAAHESTGKALAELPAVLWEGLKGAFVQLVNNVLYR